MLAKAPRSLLTIADDIGIGPNTTTGILQLAGHGIVTGSALLVNSPYAVDAIRAWRQQGSKLDIGWHPNLTLDTPISPPAQIPSLIQADGTFWPLVPFLKRWFLGLPEPLHIERELRHQLERFVTLVGHAPTFVNCHQHIGLFAPIGEILMRILAELPVKPYIRRIREPWPMLGKVPGARPKRVFLGWLGRRLSRVQEAHGFPGNDWLAGITNPVWLEDPQFFVRWLEAMPGDTVELMCHPGRLDPTLVGRDCTDTDGLLQQRVNELRWLRAPEFLEAVEAAGFRLTTAAKLIGVKTSMARAA